jgi:hypothetical protein
MAVISVNIISKAAITFLTAVVFTMIAMSPFTFLEKGSIFKVTENAGNLTAYKSLNTSICTDGTAEYTWMRAHTQVERDFVIFQNGGHYVN